MLKHYCLSCSLPAVFFAAVRRSVQQYVSASDVDGCIQVVVKEEGIEQTYMFDALLVATGRRPNVRYVTTWAI